MATRYNLKFIYYLLKYVNLKKITQKGAKPGLNREEAYDLITIFTEDETEQQKIVSKLDKQMEQIEMMKKEAEKQKNQFDNYESSIIDYYFSQENTKGWNEYLLDEFLEIIGGYAFKSSSHKKEGIQLIRLGNVKNDGLKLDANPVFRYPEEEKDFSRYILNPGDLLITLTGTLRKRDYGYVCEVPADAPKLFLNQRVGKFVFHKKIDPLFVKYLFQSSSFKDTLFEQEKGGTGNQGNLSNMSIQSIKVKIPEYNNQIKISKVLKEKIEAGKHIKKDLIVQVDVISQLPSSILNEVFGQYKIPEEA